jgi:hypothetical protein
MAKRSKYSDSGEVIYFVSNNERTLPSRDTILEKIEDCIPSNYRIINHRAVYNRFFIDETTIYYDLYQVDPNRYSINIKYRVEYKFLSTILLIAGVAIGSYFGESLFKGGWSALIGAVVGVFLVSFIVTRGEEEVPEICERITTEIKEYERAHLLSISTRYESNNIK